MYWLRAMATMFVLGAWRGIEIVRKLRNCYFGPKQWNCGHFMVWPKAFQKSYGSVGFDYVCSHWPQKTIFSRIGKLNGLRKPQSVSMKNDYYYY